VLSKLLLTILPRRPVRKAGNCCLTIAIALILVLVAGCASIMFIAGRASAAPAKGPDILLMLDHSQSLWELGGIGSDPDMLRVDAARLFINTLGVDQDLAYRLGIIAFGTDARLAAPLTPLADADQRRTLLEAVVNPQPMGWTDVNKALALAYDQLFPGGRPAPDRQPAIILMTDGRPEIETTNTAQARQAYLDRIEGWVRQFADQGTVFHTVLLSNQATDADPELQTVYRPLWLKLSREFDTVYFHEARTAADLPAIYHAIAVGLQGAQTAGPVIEESVAGHVEKKITVEPGLYRVTFVIRKSKPDIEVGIMRPDGTRLQVAAAGVRFAGDRLQEVWSVRDPAPGTWTVVLDGQGEVTVWKDFVLAPPTPTATATPVPTDTPTPTATVAPTITPIILARWQIISPKAGGTYPPGKPIPVRVRPPDVPDFPIIAIVHNRDGEEMARVTLRPDDQGDLTGEIQALDIAGDYALSLSTAEPGGQAASQDSVQVSFQIAPPGRPWMPIMGLTIVVIGLLVAAGSYVFAAQNHERSAPVEGRLRLIRAPEGERPGQQWNLDTLHKNLIAIGRAGCDVALPNDDQVPMRAADIVGRRNGSHDVDILLRPLDPTCRVNDQPAGREQPLWDRDKIQIGSYVLRYENLQRIRKRHTARRNGNVRM